MIQIQETTTAGIPTLALAGRMDAPSAPDLEHRLAEALAAGRTCLILDFSPLEFIASAGLRVLLSFAKKAGKAGCALALCGLRPEVSEVFRVTGFTTIFRIHGSADEAARALQASRV